MVGSVSGIGRNLAAQLDEPIDNNLFDGLN